MPTPSTSWQTTPNSTVNPDSELAAARLCQKGDPIIVVAYCQMPAEEARNYQPAVVMLDEHNEVIA